VNPQKIPSAILIKVQKDYTRRRGGLVVEKKKRCVVKVTHVDSAIKDILSITTEDTLSTIMIQQLIITWLGISRRGYERTMPLNFLHQPPLATKGRKTNS